MYFSKQANRLLSFCPVPYFTSLVSIPLVLSFTSLRIPPPFFALLEEEIRGTTAAVRTEEDEAMDEMIRQQDARRAGQYNILEEPMDK